MRLKKSYILFLIVLFIAGLYSCDNSFSPKNDVRELPVLSCVLVASQQIQIVRVSRMYNPPGIIPEEYTGSKSVDILSMTISDSFSNFNCKDTMLAITDGTFEKAFYTKTLKVYPDQKYSLEVQTKEYGQLHAQVNMPSAPGLALNGVTTYLILDTTKGLTAYAWEAAASNNPPFGTYFRLWIMSEHQSPSGKMDTIRDEVPLERNITNGEVKEIFPKLTRALQQTYTYAVVMEKFREVKKRGDSFTMQLKCTGYCIEKNLYSYFKIVHGFDDPLSIRTEILDYTNIENGRGIFGGMTIDSITIRYPASLIENL